MKLTDYQVAVVEKWIAEMLDADCDREEAIEHTAFMLNDLQSVGVRAVFDRCWPIDSQELAKR